MITLLSSFGGHLTFSLPLSIRNFVSATPYRASVCTVYYMCQHSFFITIAMQLSPLVIINPPSTHCLLQVFVCVS
jgi:hypothetical protein